MVVAKHLTHVHQGVVLEVAGKVDCNTTLYVYGHCMIMFSDGVR